MNHDRSGQATGYLMQPGEGERIVAKYPEIELSAKVHRDAGFMQEIQDRGITIAQLITEVLKAGESHEFYKYAAALRAASNERR